MENVFLVMCSKRKQRVVCAARELYISPFFAAARSIADTFGRCWFILSAKYGLLEPVTTVAPYDMDLASQTPQDRLNWSNDIVCALIQSLRRTDRVILLANPVYSDTIEKMLVQRRVHVHCPLRDMREEEYTAWLTGPGAKAVVWQCEDTNTSRSIVE